MRLCFMCEKNETSEEVWFHNEPLPMCLVCQKKFMKEVES